MPVVHALATTRADGYGEPRNAPLYRMAARAGKPLLAGTPAAEVIAEIGLDDRDLVVSRAGGLGPMYDTGLESLLRRLGIRTVVVAGVSVNVAILDLVLDCVNAGFEVVVPRDAVAGVPAGVRRSGHRQHAPAAGPRRAHRGRPGRLGPGVRYTVEPDRVPA